MFERYERERERERDRETEISSDLSSRKVELAAFNDQMRSVWPAATELQSLPDPNARPTSPGSEVRRDGILARKLFLHQRCLRDENHQNDRVDGSPGDGDIQGLANIPVFRTQSCRYCR